MNRQRKFIKRIRHALSDCYGPQDRFCGLCGLYMTDDIHRRSEEPADKRAEKRFVRRMLPALKGDGQ